MQIISLILFLLAAPVQPPVLQVEHTPQGNAVSWSEVGNLGSDQTLYLMRIRAGHPPLVVSSWSSIHNPPPVGGVDGAGRACDGYELRLVGGAGWKVVAPSRCIVYLPEVVSP